MAVNFIGTSLEGIDATQDGDVWIIEETVFLSDPEFEVFDFRQFSRNTLIVEGTIAAPELYEAVYTDNPSTDNLVITSDTGRIFGSIFLLGISHEIQNNGSVFGNVATSGADGAIYNTGNIYSENTAVETLGADSTFTNEGFVFGQVVGVSLGLTSNEGNNTGTIIGRKTGVWLPTGEHVFDNSGEISVIDPRGNAILGGTQEQNITNTGTITGSVKLDRGDDFFDGRGGRVNGTIEAGDDDDTIYGGMFRDVILGGQGSDFISGGNGDDVLDAGGASDTVFGGDGNDRLDGRKGDDTLRAGKGDDFLKGSAGSDLLAGGDGRDRLDGGAGQDVLIGGKGDDLLTGGTGPDIFVFSRDAGSDRITDFENGADLLDLRASGLNPNLFETRIAPFLVGNDTATSLDLANLGGMGVLVIEGLAIGDADVSDFIL